MMMLRLALALMLSAAPSLAGAASNEPTEGFASKLLAPGPLIEAHQDLEHSRCLDCHVTRRGVPDTKCLTCHKDIGERVAAKRGFHGQLKDSCIHCHTDHKGRSFDSLSVDPKSFNHDQTGFKLEDKHHELKCTDCHTEKRARSSQPRYFGTNASCVSCHRKDDVHFFAGEWAKKDCGTCHGSQSWKHAQSFDHGKDAKYPLLGKHENLKCATCHLPEKGAPIYAWPDLARKDCETCHKSPHRENVSAEFKDKKCSDCHTEQGWNLMRKGEQGFDHARTRFALTGKHMELHCDECHHVGKRDQYRFEHSEQQFCVDCHQNVHRNQFSAETTNRSCADCHTTKDFTKRKPFDHSKTPYPLLGEHAKVDCEKCHTSTSEKFPAPSHHPMNRFSFPELTTKSCTACHQDPHQGVFGPKCTDCHNESGWKQTADFHKNFTLSGVHYSLGCNECHKQGRRLSGMSQMCIVCHQKDDIHHGTLPQCGSCHQQQFWENADFKHSLSRFPLRGAHRTLDCIACHARGIYKGTPSNCVDCHLNDALRFQGTPDHRLIIGRNCSECHNQFSFQ